VGQQQLWQHRWATLQLQFAAAVVAAFVAAAGWQRLKLHLYANS